MKSIEDIRNIGMKVLITLLWVNAALIAARAIFVSHPQMIALVVGGLAMALLGTITWRADKGGAVARSTAGLTQAAQVALLVGAFSGSSLQIDIHMYFFAMLAICAACVDWRPILAFTGLTAVHHVVLYFVIPAAIFPGESSIIRVGLHAVILVAEAGVLLALTNMMSQSLASTRIAISEAQSAKEDAVKHSLAAEEAQDANAKAQESLNAEKEEANAQLQAVIDELGAGLSSLAQGDVTYRIRAEFGGQFAKLQEDFNASVRKLEYALSSVVTTASGLHDNANEMKGSSDELALRAERQAAALKQTSAAVNRISESIEQSSGQASDASDKVSGAKEKTEHSGEVVASAIDAMDEIKKSSEQVSQILTVIDEIAFQTNLLALNAGVEAARAGEAGKGFAVVAQEVRELAQRSADAAKEIKQLIDKSASQVENGVNLVNETGGSLKDIAQEVFAINELIGGITSTFQEQTSGLRDINSALSEMDNVTNKNAQMASHTTQSIQGLSAGVDKLVNELSMFTVHSEYQGSYSAADVQPLKATG